MKEFWKMAKGLLLVCGALLAGIAFSGCGTTHQEPVFTSSPVLDAKATGDATTNGQGGSILDSTGVYRFKVGDLIVVTFSGTPDPIPPFEERIKEDGNVTLQYIGAVRAKDRTAGELQRDIYDRYVPKYYTRLNVTVKQQNIDLFYFVTGEVRAPGPKPFISATTVTKAISTAGGLSEFARKSRIQLRRANGSKVTVDWNKAIENPNLDPQVLPGDSVYVPRAWW